MKQRFDLGTVLSITTGTLLTPIDNIYKILNHISGRELFTHELPEVAKQVSAIILYQYPELKKVDTSKVNTTNWKSFLEEQIKLYGNTFRL